MKRKLLSEKITFIISFIASIICSISVLYAQSSKAMFEELPDVFEDIHYAAIDLGDYNNDGYVDLIFTGMIDIDNDGTPDASIMYLYENQEGSTFTKIEQENFYGLHLGAVKFIDIDNDGDLDIVATGQNFEDILTHLLYIYENVDGIYEVKYTGQGCIFSGLDVGDYNNDGYQDFILSGWYSDELYNQKEIFKIFKNDGNGDFQEVENNITPISLGNIKFADINNDGKLDIITMGYTDNQENMYLKTYLNENNSFIVHQIIDEGYSNGGFELADFDNDGDPDIVLIGEDIDYEAINYIYWNTNDGIFEKDTSNEFLGLACANNTNFISTGDYNNNGNFDFIAVGSDADYNEFTMLYANNNGNFTEVEHELPNVGNCASALWLDFDNDNDLDLLLTGYTTTETEDYTTKTYLFKNNNTITNLSPTPPAEINLTAETNVITCKWTAGNDDITPENSLRYLLTLSTEEGKADIASVEVINTEWKFYNIKDENIYMSVQTIDGANVKSEKISAVYTLNINENDLEKDFLLYPNPVKHVVNLSNIDINKIQKINIIDNNGKIVLSTNSTNCINLETLSTGIYFVEVVLYNSKTISAKIIKQ